MELTPLFVGRSLDVLRKSGCETAIEQELLLTVREGADDCASDIDASRSERKASHSRCELGDSGGVALGWRSGDVCRKALGPTGHWGVSICWGDYG